MLNVYGGANVIIRYKHEAPSTPILCTEFLSVASHHIPIILLFAFFLCRGGGITFMLHRVDNKETDFLSTSRLTWRSVWSVPLTSRRVFLPLPYRSLAVARGQAGLLWVVGRPRGGAHLALLCNYHWWLYSVCMCVLPSVLRWPTAV